MVKSIHLLHTQTSDDKRAQTEHLCHVCWTSKKVSHSLGGFLQAQKKARASGGTYADVLGRLEEQRP